MAEDNEKLDPASPDGAADRRPDLPRLAHELRTPLAAIAALSEIMRDERLGPLADARYRGYASDIHESAKHAMSVVGGFLDPAAGQGPMMPVDFVELDAGELAAGVVSALTPLAGQHGVHLTADITSDLPRLIADRRCLRQILNNLIANALKFTPPGGSVTLTVSYHTGGPIVLGVADTGDGMTPDELARARAGTSAPEPIRRRSGGTGFGLPLVRALAAASGATLDIDSARARARA